MIAAEIEPVPGLLDVLAELKACGIKAAVGTSGPPENVTLVLRGLRLKSYWQSVVTGADVSRSKPAPDIFLLAAEKLGFPARRCLVFEDSTAGIEAAHRAGCPCIALSTTHSAEELKSYPVIKIIPDFTLLRAAEVRSIDSQPKM
jgi:HAD superfamily hydrolase (TIGR01509 family)